MSDKTKLTKAYFNNPFRCDVLEFGRFFDPWFGVAPAEITEEQIEALRQGKVLYITDGEYATIIRLAERKESCIQEQ